MNYSEEVKQTLINNTVQLIAEGGFERATTRAIALGSTPQHGVKLNEAYIYRLFGGKEELYREVFSLIDQNFSSEICKFIDDNEGLGVDARTHLYPIFNKVWNLFMTYEMPLKCYIRYYHSSYFKEESIAIHGRNFKKVVDKFTMLFREEADVSEIMHSVFMSLLNFAVRVYNGILENRPDNVEHIFNVLYCITSYYLKDSSISQKRDLSYV